MHGHDQTFELTIRGVTSLVRSSGPVDAREAVVFVHGNPGSSEDWTALRTRIGGFARSIAPDMPGYGKADRPVDFAYDVPGYARHLAGLVEALGVERVHLVLHDFGVPWGLYWACEHAARVASVTLINCGILPGYSWHKYAALWRTPGLGELLMYGTTRSLFGALLAHENPKPFPKSFVDRMWEDLDAGTKRAILRLYRATSAAVVGSMPIAERLAALRLPALVLWGGEDRNCPPRYAELQRPYFEQAEIHVLEGCGHWPFIDEPERVGDLLEAFLRRN